MTKERRVTAALWASGAVVVLMVSSGCVRTNRGFVRHAGHAKCSSAATTIPIYLDGSEKVLKDLNDEVILVCPNDIIVWKVADDAVTTVKSFTVDFRNKNNPGKLFDSGRETLESAGAPPEAGRSEKVKGNGDSSTHPHYDKDFVYSITTFGADHAQLHSIDPHVIPVGN